MLKPVGGWWRSTFHVLKLPYSHHITSWPLGRQQATYKYQSTYLNLNAAATSVPTISLFPVAWLVTNSGGAVATYPRGSSSPAAAAAVAVGPAPFSSVTCYRICAISLTAQQQQQQWPTLDCIHTKQSISASPPPQWLSDNSCDPAPWLVLQPAIARRDHHFTVLLCSAEIMDWQSLVSAQQVSPWPTVLLSERQISIINRGKKLRSVAEQG